MLVFVKPTNFGAQVQLFENVAEQFVCDLDTSKRPLNAVGKARLPTHYAFTHAELDGQRRRILCTNETSKFGPAPSLIGDGGWARWGGRRWGWKGVGGGEGGSG